MSQTWGIWEGKGREFQKKHDKRFSTEGKKKIEVEPVAALLRGIHSKTLPGKRGGKMSTQLLEGRGSGEGLELNGGP